MMALDCQGVRQLAFNRQDVLAGLAREKIRDRSGLAVVCCRVQRSPALVVHAFDIGHVGHKHTECGCKSTARGIVHRRVALAICAAHRGTNLQQTGNTLRRARVRGMVDRGLSNTIWSVHIRALLEQNVQTLERSSHRGTVQRHVSFDGARIHLSIALKKIGHAFLESALRSLMQRSAAIVGLVVDTGLVGHKQADLRDHSELGSNDERRLADIVHRVEQRVALLHEQQRTGCVLVRDRMMHRGPALGVLDIHGGTVGKQHRCALGVSELCSLKKCGPAFFVAVVHRGALLEQASDPRGLVVAHGKHKWVDCGNTRLLLFLVLALVESRRSKTRALAARENHGDLLVPEIESNRKRRSPRGVLDLLVGAGREQTLHTVDVALDGSKMQSRGAVGILLVNLGNRMVDQCLQGVAVARTSGNVDRRAANKVLVASSGTEPQERGHGLGLVVLCCGVQRAVAFGIARVENVALRGHKHLQAAH
eukprot:comp22425_c0_seq1/m.54888 comp22425_c0_seq1/g.54888  ORF comp22425_c0_seq1/g.54888 comp22425_c0_seq1/m.54888 type:complete len:480 (+) comp22425_c0_seq1:3469-4908(+)